MYKRCAAPTHGEEYKDCQEMQEAEAASEALVRKLDYMMRKHPLVDVSYILDKAKARMAEEKEDV